MWKPPERIKHTPPPGEWPTAQEADGALWFQPIQLGSTRLAQRTWVPAMVPWRATQEGLVTPEVLAWYGRFAAGKPGAIVVEATGIREVPSGPLLRIGHDRFIAGLRELVETVRRASDGETRFFIQLIDFLNIRRRPRPEKFFGRYLQLTDEYRQAVRERQSSGLGEELCDTDVRLSLLAMSAEEHEEILSSRDLEALRYGFRERVTDLDKEHIRRLPDQLPDLFASAASRAREAGFDGVELHYAHAYTMASFLSALNSRQDGYGGPRENRIRLPLEVLARVRAKVGEDFTVGCRYLSEDCIAGGSTVEDAAYFGVELAGAGMDFLSLSRGGKFEDAKQPRVGWTTYPYTGPSGYECMPVVRSDAQGPFGRNVEPTARIRQAVRAAGMETPIVVSGGICSFAQAEEILRTGKADIVGAARQSLADPDWFLKVRLGQGEAVRRCVFTNYCEGLDQMHKKVTCQLWDRLELDERGIQRSADGRRRLIAPSWTPSDPAGGTSQED